MTNRIRNKVLSSESTPFDIPELRNPNIEALLKKAILSKSTFVPLDLLKNIYSYTNTIQNSACIVAYTCRIFDQFGSHHTPVYKSLVIIIGCLETKSAAFFHAAKALTPEFLMVIYLSFREKKVLFRDAIHRMAHSIYNYLMYDEPLQATTEIDKVANPQLVPPEEYKKLKNPYDDDGENESDYDFSASSSDEEPVDNNNNNNNNSNSNNNNNSNNNIIDFNNLNEVNNNGYEQYQKFTDESPEEIKQPFINTAESRIEPPHTNIENIASREAPADFSNQKDLEFNGFRSDFLNGLRYCEQSLYDPSIEFC